MPVDEFPHQFLEVPRRGGQHRVDSGRRTSTQVVLLLPEEPDKRLYGRPALRNRVALPLTARSQYPHSLYCSLATASPVIGKPLREFYAVGLHQLQQGLYRVAVVRVPAERLYRYDDLLLRRAQKMKLILSLSIAISII